MGIFDRIILSIYTLSLALLSLGVVLLALQIIPLNVVWTSISLIHGQWEAALVGAIFLLSSIRLLLAGLRSHREKGAILHHTDMGDIQIAIDAVENLIVKAARHVKGVRGAKVKVTSATQGLSVVIKAVISPESHVPTVSAEIQQQVHAYAKNTVGIEFIDVRIIVENIANDFKKQRVE